MDSWLLEKLACPRDQRRLDLDGNHLCCPDNHRYPVVAGIPIMLLHDVPQTLRLAKMTLMAASGSFGADDPYYVETLGGLTGEQRQEIRERLHAGTGAGVDPVVQYLVGPTCGHLYRHLMGKLAVYPIPELRLPNASGSVFLDIGCSWGRWCVAAARKGYIPIGIDPSLGAVLAARRLTDELGLPAQFVVADARFLPFRPSTFDVVFSYSVLQHFSKLEAKLVLADVARVLKQRGTCLVQMPNRFGLWNMLNRALSGFKEARSFDVRYWAPGELKEVFTRLIGETTLSVDGYFGLGVQASDARLFPLHFRGIVALSDFLRKLSQRRRWMCSIADSLYVTSTLRRAS